MDTPRPSLRRQIRDGLTLVCALIALGASVGTLAGFASRWWHVGELACHFRAQYFWACLLGAVVLGIGRWWRSAALLALPAIVNLALIVGLESVTKMSFLIWMALGLIIYFTYSRHRSVVGR